MASKDSQRKKAPTRGGTVKRTLQEIVIFLDSNDEDNVQGLNSKEHIIGNPQNEEVEVFSVNILTEPTVEAFKSSKTPLLKWKVARGEGPKRKPKKSKIPQLTAGIVGVEGASVNDPGVKGS
ncbi:hypothetical protein LIER_09133 [Lithospermum erythrorhizon]|uniref:Uncharacterized protein n=1 Tax=Lithospermum erythrorhizon TaxID=34254 RepID=A0AAV3PGR2_LITER